MLDEAAVIALADVAPREELLARLAGGMAAPMTNMARLLQAAAAEDGLRPVGAHRGRAAHPMPRRRTGSET